MRKYKNTVFTPYQEKASLALWAHLGWRYFRRPDQLETWWANSTDATNKIGSVLCQRLY